MTQIRLQDFGYGFVEPLFSGVNLTISDSDVIGIVGNNGEGKSTFLKCLAGVLDGYEGTIAKSRSAVVGHVTQDVPADLQHLSLYEVVCSALPTDERVYNAWRADIALDDFEAPQDIRNKPLSELSGGWQRLALIARMVITEPDVLLLDEPTNHLDVDKIQILETWLKEQMRGKAVVMVSHDRRFLDRCTNRTIFIRKGQVVDYRHPYTVARQLLAEDDSANEAQRAREMKEARRLVDSAHALRQIGVNDHSDSALQKARRMTERAASIEGNFTPVHVERERDITLDTGDTHAKRLIGIERVEIIAPDGTALFHIDKLDIMRGQRIVILGANGAGKTQFIQRLLRAFQNRDDAKSEGISITPTAKPGYIDQHLSGLLGHATLRDYVADAGIADANRTTALLDSIGFPYADQKQLIATLSQGQRARLNLLGLRLLRPNFYLMDEPTNHLDIAGQEALEQEIITSDAACILVSHDREFIGNVGTVFYEIKGRRLIAVERPDEYQPASLEGNAQKSRASTLTL